MCDVLEKDCDHNAQHLQVATDFPSVLLASQMIGVMSSGELCFVLRARFVGPPTRRLQNAKTRLSLFFRQFQHVVLALDVPC